MNVHLRVNKCHSYQIIVIFEIPDVNLLITKKRKVNFIMTFSRVLNCIFPFKEILIGKNILLFCSVLLSYK